MQSCIELFQVHGHCVAVLCLAFAFEISDLRSKLLSVNLIWEIDVRPKISNFIFLQVDEFQLCPQDLILLLDGIIIVLSSEVHAVFTWKQCVKKLPEVVQLRLRGFSGDGRLQLFVLLCPGEGIVDNDGNHQVVQDQRAHCDEQQPQHSDHRLIHLQNSAEASPAIQRKALEESEHCIRDRLHVQLHLLFLVIIQIQATVDQQLDEKDGKHV
mmetsp:Transcript_67714/g.148594  ORF Transcript_67714/g.148594 Transcript_67714/m.148594 type:complete len:212 (+) Transcript_67714:404-1039(+)